MFGLRLPVNFDSPYKAGSIIEFWRRWHMTLSRFLRDYVYISLGGNRKGEPRRYVNLFLTMLIGGIWHGAGWTYVVWGTLHGLCLVINHAWRQFVTPRLTLPAPPGRRGGGFVMADHLRRRRACMGVLPGADVQRPRPSSRECSACTAWARWRLPGSMPCPQPRDGHARADAAADPAGIALLMPNVRELMGSAFPALKDDGQKRQAWIAQWRPDLRWAAVVAVAGGWAIIASSGIQLVHLLSILGRRHGHVA